MVSGPLNQPEFEPATYGLGNSALQANFRFGETEMVTAPGPRCAEQFGIDGWTLDTVEAGNDDWAGVRVKRKFASELAQ